MTIAETLEWFDEHGYVFRARYDNQNQFSAEVLRKARPNMQQEVGGAYPRGNYDESDVSIRVFALQGQSPDEIVRRLMRAVEALEGITP
mgnify:FL=1